MRMYTVRSCPVVRVVRPSRTYIPPPLSYIGASTTFKFQCMYLQPLHLNNLHLS